VTVSRPVLRWHGGKWKLAPWIIGHFPSHRFYFEPFGGAGSVLLRKPPALVEIYNDLDDRLVNFFRVLRDDDRRRALLRALSLTPFAEAEYITALEPCLDDPVEDARRLAVRQAFAHGTDSARRASGFRIEVFSDFKRGPYEWRRYSRALARTTNRLRNVCISKRDWKALMRRASADTLIYLDPPYVPDTRCDGSRAYAHELTAAAHDDLLSYVASAPGMIILSGYPHDSYDAALPAWQRVEKATFADGARPRTEVLWINPHCWQRLNAERAQLELLEGAA
jgi:DNA adenine methylase